MTTPRFFSILALTILSWPLACKSDDGGDTNGLSNEEACQNIIEACHTKDDGSDPVINGCHENAHDGGDCLKDYDMCLKACNDAPAISGGHESHGTHGSGTHGSGTHGGGTHGSGTHGSGTHGSGTHGSAGTNTGTAGTSGGAHG